MQTLLWLAMDLLKLPSGTKGRGRVNTGEAARTLGHSP